jgi:putative DNA primase/helicase
MSMLFEAAADVEMKTQDWLWPGWLSAGKLHLLAGEAGTGKTTLALAIAAAITTGGTLPDGTDAPLGGVLFWSGEDNVEDTITPRLYAAHADSSKFAFVTGTMSEYGVVEDFNPLQGGVHNIEAELEMRDEKPRLLIIDPITACVPSMTNQAVREGLTPWVRMAERTGMAILGITHVSKGSSRKALIDRVLGAQAFSAVSRVVMMTAKTPTGETVLVRAKSNISSKRGGYTYRLRDVDFENPLKPAETIFSSYVQFGDYIDLPAEEIVDGLNHSDAIPSRSDEAVAWLHSILMSGGRLRVEIEDEALCIGHSWATIRRAKTILRVQSKKGTDGRWWWVMPITDKQDWSRAAHKTGEHLEHLELGDGGVVLNRPT